MSAQSPAPISPASISALECLAAAAGNLLVDLRVAVGLCGERTPTTGPNTADNVARYLALVAEGVSTNDGVLALRGANLLTTVNKGVGDLETAPADLLGEKAFNVTRAAIAAAKSLRADLGNDH